LLKLVDALSTHTGAAKKMDAEQEAAASRIAAAKKGKQARQEAKEQKDAASKVAAMEKGRRQRKDVQERQKAAATLQSRQRGNRARKRNEKAGQRYYTASEVMAHNRADDLWVSFFGRVYDLTNLVAENPGHLVQPIVDAAGTDISHWFDPVTKQVRTYVDPETEFEMPFTPMGAFLHCPPAVPTAQWSSNIDKAWWKDRSMSIGSLTAKTRKLTLYNMLNKVSTTLEVCAEETLEEIQRRYLAFNGHSSSYTWKRTDSNAVARILNMRETLDANGIPDESLAFDALNIDEDQFIPIIHLYFSDDLTVA